MSGLHANPVEPEGCDDDQDALLTASGPAGLADEDDLDDDFENDSDGDEKGDGDEPPPRRR